MIGYYQHHRAMGSDALRGERFNWRIAKLVGSWDCREFVTEVNLTAKTVRADCPVCGTAICLPADYDGHTMWCSVCGLGGLTMGTVELEGR